MGEKNKVIIKQALENLHFDSDGLIPVIAQQFDTNEVLMLAWMNCDAVIATLEKAEAVYWSRSRQKLWHKGETSGQTQYVKEFRWDCDGDTILLQVDQKGVACHTGRRTCFFWAIRENKIKKISAVEIDPAKLYK